MSSQRPLYQVKKDGPDTFKEAFVNSSSDSLDMSSSTFTQSFSRTFDRSNAIVRAGAGGTTTGAGFVSPAFNKRKKMRIKRMESSRKLMELEQQEDYAVDREGQVVINRD